MKTELELLHDQLSSAIAPEDAFGIFPGLNGENLKKNISSVYKRLARICHPDGHPGAAEFATTVFGRLNTLHRAAMQKVDKNAYGDRAPMHGDNVGEYDSPILVKDTYMLYRSYAAGDIADLHLCRVEEPGRKPKDFLFKSARVSKDNMLMDRERTSLELLQKKLHGDWRSCVPRIQDSFLLVEGSSKDKKRVNILEVFKGFVDVEAIHVAYPSGVDARTIAWMWKRLLLMLDWTHKIGLLHGAVLPPHVMYYPDNDGGIQRDKRKHSVHLVDWCYSVKNDPSSKMVAWCPKYKSFYAPEILTKKPLGPGTDLYMGAKTMLYLLGGDVETNAFPAHVPKEIVNSFAQCLQVDLTRRPGDAGLYFEEFTRTLQRLYGPPKYHQFIMPK